MELKDRPDVVEALMAISNLTQLNDFIDGVGYLSFNEYNIALANFSNVYIHDLFLTHVQVNLDAVDDNGNTFLHVIADNRFKNNLSKYLVTDRLMDAYAKNNDGKTPHDLAYESGNTELSDFYTKKKLGEYYFNNMSINNRN